MQRDVHVRAISDPTCNRERVNFNGNFEFVKLTDDWAHENVEKSAEQQVKPRGGWQAIEGNVTRDTERQKHCSQTFVKTNPQKYCNGCIVGVKTCEN